MIDTTDFNRRAVEWVTRALGTPVTLAPVSEFEAELERVSQEKYLETMRACDVLGR